MGAAKVVSFDRPERPESLPCKGKFGALSGSTESSFWVDPGRLTKLATPRLIDAQ
jgi:hypothetical protein